MNDPSSTDLPSDLIPLQHAAKRLGITRATMWRKVHQLNLNVYLSPVDTRQRLLSWSEISERMKPANVIVVASGKGTAEQMLYDTYSSVLEKQTGLHVSTLPEESQVVRARLLASRAIDTFAAGSDLGAAIIQGEGPFAARDLGPFPIRDWYPTEWNEVCIGYITRRVGGLSSIWDIGRGTRLADVRGLVPGMAKVYEALLGWVQVDPGDVSFVPYCSVTDSIRAVTVGEVDLSYAIPMSEAVAEAERTAAGIAWLDLNPNASPRDAEGARRHRSIVPNVAFRPNREGVSSSIGFWGIWWPGNYAVRYVHADADADFVYNLARWRDEKRAPAGQEHSALFTNTLGFVRAALPEVFIPIHEGAIRYFREQGIWTETDDRRQRMNLSLLDAYIRAWRAALAEASRRRIRVDSTNERWLRVWHSHKSDLPVPTSLLHLDAVTT